MVHELLGIQDNRVDLTKLPKVPKDLQVFTPHYYLSIDFSERYQVRYFYNEVYSLILNLLKKKISFHFEMLVTRSNISKYYFGRNLCCRLSRMHFSKQICTKTLETESEKQSKYPVTW
jgi:hypothetical protein